MRFAPGDRVHLAGLGTGTVREARGGERYAVEIKGRLVVAAGKQLEPADARSPRSGSEPARDHRPPSPVPTGSPTLDLHGRTVADSLEAVEVFISDALIAGHGEVRIIHGRSGGSVRAAVHRYLKRIAAVAGFRLDPRNPGVTIVTFP